MNRRFVKIISVVMIISMIATSCVFAGSENTKANCSRPNVSNKTTVEVNGFEFDILECENEDCSITREYQKESDVGLTYDQTIALMYALGMNEKEIYANTKENLNEISKTDKIKVTVVYSKIDGVTGSVINLSEYEALNQLENNLSENECTDPVKLIGKHKPTVYTTKDDIICDKTAVLANDSRTFQDSWMRITTTCTHVTGTTNDYRIATYATWLNSPTLRWKDAVGISATNCTIQSGTLSGYLSYTETTVISGVSTSSQTKYNSITWGNLYNLSNGGWRCGAGLVDLPKDSLDLYDQTGVNIYCSNIFEYVSCYITVSSTATSFSVAGSHSHGKGLFNSSLSVGLDSTGGVELTPTSTILQDKRKETISVTI